MICFTSTAELLILTSSLAVVHLHSLSFLLMTQEMLMMLFAAEMDICLMAFAFVWNTPREAVVVVMTGVTMTEVVEEAVVVAAASGDASSPSFPSLPAGKM
jgi:uncharacterized membrane protein YfhO